MFGVKRRLLFWLAVMIAALGLGVGATAAGSQPEPSIKVKPDEAQPGETVTVIGECWGGCDDQPAVVSPVTLTLLQAETEVPDFEAVEVDLDPPADGSFEQEIVVPPGLDEGKYKLAAESRDGDTATDKLLVGQSTSDDGDGGDDGDDGDDDGDGNDDGDDSDDEDDPDRSSADPEDCTAPPLTPQPPAPAGVDTQAPAADTQTADSDQADDCASATPPPTAPADQAVLGESQSSNGSNGNSGSDSSDGSGNGDSADEDEGDEDDDRERNKDKRALKNADGDSDAGDDEGSGAGGAGNGNDRGQDGAAANRSPVETVRAAAGPTPEDIRESVPWAMIALLGALFAIGLGATYHVVGRWAPDPADVG